MQTLINSKLESKTPSQQEILQLGLDHFVAVSLITRVRVRYGWLSSERTVCHLLVTIRRSAYTYISKYTYIYKSICINIYRGGIIVVVLA